MAAFSIDGAGVQPQARPCGEKQPTAVTDLGERYTYGSTFDPASQGDFSFDEDHQGKPIKYLRALISVRNASHGLWVLSVRDASFHLVEVLTGSDFKQSSERWTARVEGPMLRLDFDNIQGASDVSFVHEESIVMRNTERSYYNLPPGAQKAVALYKNNSHDVTEEIRRWGDFVGFLMSSDGRASWSCSGVAVAPDLFLTNWHCGGTTDGSLGENAYWKTNCPSTLIDMSWDDDAISHEYRCEKVEDLDRDLDFALLKVQPVSASGSLRPAVISLSLPANNRVTIIHHPAAERKQVSAGCRVVSPAAASWHDRVPGVDFTHACHTESGSSGAPVFDDRGRVVGLHHWGRKFNTTSCSYEDDVNKAVHIDKIIDHLRKKDGSIAARLRIVSGL